MALQRTLAWLSFVLCFNFADVTARIQPRDICDDIGPYLSSFSSYPTATVTSLCSSLLNYPNDHATTTRTLTARSTTTVTQTLTTRKRVSTITTRPTLTITTAVVVTRKFTSTVPYTVQGAKVRRQAVAPPPLTVQNGKVLGRALSVASQACSCIVHRPTSTVITRTTSISTVTKEVTTTRTRTTTIISQPIRTVTRTTTLRITSTICTGTNPSPSFKLQFKDTGSTDQYNNQFLSYAPYAPSDGFDGDELSGVPTRADGKVFWTDCVGRLTADGSFGELEYFFAIGSQDIAAVYLGNQTEYLGYDSSTTRYLLCEQADGFLDCSANGGYTILQTTPYYEPLGTTVVIGKVVGNNEFYPFRWKVYAI